MKKLVNLTFQKNQVLEKHSRILFAMSGGQDSNATLLFLLHALPSDKKDRFDPPKLYGIPSNLELLYCQHFWQTKNFFSSRFVFVLSWAFEIPFNMSLPQTVFVTENRSRNWRKQNFWRVTQLQKHPSLVIGETETDRVERNLYVLIRGTSPQGFSPVGTLNRKKSSNLFFAPVILTPRVSPSCSFFQFQNIYEINKFFKQRKNKKFSLKTKNGIGSKTECFGNVTKQSFKFQFSKPKHTNKKYPFFPSIKIGIKNKSRHTHNFDFYQKNRKLSYPQLLQSSSFCFYSKSLRKNVHSLKPLAKISRFTITKVITTYNVPLVNDITNFSPDFSRNKIRHQILPLVRYLFHKKFDLGFERFEESLREQNQSLEKKILEFSSSMKTVKSKDFKIKSQISHNNKKLKTQQFSVWALFFETERTIQYALIHKIFSDYREIELSCLQISRIETILALKKNKEKL